MAVGLEAGCEVKSLVSAWRALHLCLSFSTRQEDNRRPTKTTSCVITLMMNFGIVSNVDLSKVHQCYGQPVEVPGQLSKVWFSSRLL